MKEWRKNKKQWRTRTVGTNRQVGTHYPLEPHGNKRGMPKGITVVTPPIARKLEMAKVNVDKLPKTVFHDKKDNDRVKYFMDLLHRGIVPPPAEIHKRPDGTWEILDGKHRIEAYRRLGYKKIPVVTNATVGEIAKALGDEYEDGLFSQQRSFGEKRELAMRAIQAQRGNPLVNEDNPAAFDALNPLSSGETQVDEILGDKKRRVIKSGDLVTGKRGEFRTRTVGTEAQIGTHFPLEPHGDRSALPKGMAVVVPPMYPSGSVSAGHKHAGFDVQYVDVDIRDKHGNKYMAMNYREAAEMGVYFPYSEDTIIVSKSLSKEEQERVLEMQVREIAKMKKGASYLEAHAQVITEMPQSVPKKAGFWDAVKGLATSAMERQQKAIEAQTAKHEKDKLFSEVSKTGLKNGVKAADNAKESNIEIEPSLEEVKAYAKVAKKKTNTKVKA